MDSLDENTIEFIFNLIGNGECTISAMEMRQFMIRNGFLPDDIRWTKIFEGLLYMDKLNIRNFETIYKKRMFEIEKAAMSGLVIPQFKEFIDELEIMFDSSKKLQDGVVKNKDLSEDEKNKFGVSVCTTDGQRHNMGDTSDDFCVKSVCKPITYGIVLEIFGDEFVHNWIDKEPSGQEGNALVLTPDGLPYNCIVNTGALVVCALYLFAKKLSKPKNEEESDSTESTRHSTPSVKNNSSHINHNHTGKSLVINKSEKFSKILEWWKKLAGGSKSGFNNSEYLNESKSADINFAIAHMLKGKNRLPEGTDINSLIEFYYQLFSIEMNCKNMSILAASLANGGVCPITQERVFSTDTTRAVLSMMYSCGMHSQSGQFAYTVGLPAKSGANGTILVVIPGVCGLCLYSPKVINQNSVRGLDFIKRLVGRFTFHNFDNSETCDTLTRSDPTRDSKKYNQTLITEFLYSCSENDINIVQRLIVYGMDVNCCDYDFRTPLHLAVYGNHYEVAQLLLKSGANPLKKDRWNNTPVDDALKYCKNEKIIELIKKYADAYRVSFEKDI